jgi:ubiquinone/menaquinone biosynthesis C-methylase UbiE
LRRPWADNNAFKVKTREAFNLQPMNLEQAKELIAFENRGLNPQLWLDLGAGTGLFTVALANYLPATSKIIAVDTNAKALKQIPANVNSVGIETRMADFIDDALDVKAADGILMANSLHYVEDKVSFLNKLAPLLKTNGYFLLVEYNRTRANQWVPYPLTINDANLLFKKAGYLNFGVLNKRPSAFGDEMYAAIIN